MTVKSGKIRESRLFSAFIMAFLTLVLLAGIQTLTTASGQEH
jgi:hypothetical protein